MKKIIMMGLLSTVGLCDMIIAANPEGNPEDAVEGVVTTGEFVEAVMGVEDPLITEAVSMLQTIREGFVPTEILELFADITKIDVSQRSNPAIMQSMFTALRDELRVRLADDGVRCLNILLKFISTPMTPTSPTLPLAQVFFGELNDDLTADSFFAHLARAYNTLFASSHNISIANINTPMDWVTVQFLGLFFDNAISNLRFNFKMARLNNVDLIKEVVSGLNGAAMLNLFWAPGFQNSQQLEILQAIAEIRPKHTHIITDLESVADLDSFVTSITDPSLHTFSKGAKIDISLIVNFQHRELHERIDSLTAVFERISDRLVPYVWDLMFNLKNLENVAHGDLTPLIRSVVRSPIGANLALPTLVSDHPMTGYVMTRFKEEFLSPESKLQLLDFEGSQLSDEGWKQLALLAETKKPIKKIRLTGMQIPSAIAGRLGMLRVVGINMVGCNVKATDLTDMVAGWLGEGSTLRGVDMRGNEVNEIVATLFIEKGFEVYFQDRIQPQGYMFAKP